MSCKARSAASWQPLGSTAAFKPKPCFSQVVPRQWLSMPCVFRTWVFLPNMRLLKDNLCFRALHCGQTYHTWTAFWGSAHRNVLPSIFPFTGVSSALGSEGFLCPIWPRPHLSFTSITPQHTSYPLNPFSVLLTRGPGLMPLCPGKAIYFVYAVTRAHRPQHRGC